MSEDVLGTGAPKRTIAIWCAIAALVLIVVGTVIAFAVVPGLSGPIRSGADPSPTPSVTATPAPAATPSSTTTLADDDATDVIEMALAAPFASVGTSADLTELLRNVAVDSYAAELEAQWQELVSQGWTIAGTPTLISTDVTDLDMESDAPTATVTACVDSSAVTISDSAGKPIGDPAAMTPRALHLFSLIQGSDDVWRISAHSFPNDPTC